MLTIAGLLALVCAPGTISGQVLLTQDEALELAFSRQARIERATAYLTEGQLEMARRLAGGSVQVNQRVVTYYVGRVAGREIGVAYFDAHRVRTMREVAMVVVSPGGTVQRVEVLSFLEPPEYMASGPWVEQLTGQRLTDDLAVNRGIVNMTGATLTAGALTRATRRILALHEVIRPVAASDG